MSDKRTGKKKKKLRPTRVEEPIIPSANAPVSMPQKPKKPSKG
jgi:hypothetical protein